MATTASLVCLDCIVVLKAARAAQIAKWVHEQDSGRWAVAQWQEQQAQWQWHEPVAPQGMGTAYCFSFAKTLSGVSRNYSTRAGAIASLRGPRPENHLCAVHEAERAAADRALAAELQAADDAAWERDRASREAEEREAHRRQMEDELERERLEAEAEQRDYSARVSAAAEEERAAQAARESAWWARVAPGTPIYGARDLTIVAVDREARRFTARTPKGDERVYTVQYVSETGSVTLGSVAAS